MVEEFQRAVGGFVASEPTLDVPADVRELRLRLIEEEVAELRDALADDDVVGVADALADLLYVSYGAALAFGIPIEEVFAEVHRSNLTKLAGDSLTERDDGKVLKPAGWSPPDVAGVLSRHRSETTR